MELRKPQIDQIIVNCYKLILALEIETSMFGVTISLSSWDGAIGKVKVAFSTTPNPCKIELFVIGNRLDKIYLDVLCNIELTKETRRDLNYMIYQAYYYANVFN